MDGEDWVRISSLTRLYSESTSNLRRKLNEVGMKRGRKKESWRRGGRGRGGYMYNWDFVLKVLGDPPDVPTGLIRVFGQGSQMRGVIQLDSEIPRPGRGKLRCTPR